MTRRRLLVIDDEDLVRNAIKRLLERQHDVVAVKSVDEAIQLIADGASFDLIFSDLMMPLKTGIDFFHELAALRPGEERRIVFVTGGAFTESARAFLDSVPNVTVEKPFSPSRLRQLVDAL